MESMGPRIPLLWTPTGSPPVSPRCASSLRRSPENASMIGGYSTESPQPIAATIT